MPQDKDKPFFLMSLNQLEVIVEALECVVDDITWPPHKEIAKTLIKAIRAYHVKDDGP